MTEKVEPLRIGFVGCGNIAHVHMRFVSKIGHKVTSVLDSSQTRGQLFAQKYHISNCFTDSDEFFNEKPHVVHILTPPHTHYHLIMRALQAGCHVLVEKPLCETVAEYHEIVSVAAHRGLSVCVDHTRVYNPMISAARAKVQSGRLGRIIRMEYSYDDPSIIKSRLASDNYRWTKGTPPWFARVRGGVLTDLLPHPLSVLLSFDSDLEVKHVQARLLSGGVAEELVVLMQSQGTDAQISLSLNQRPLKNLLSVYCEKGTLLVDLRGMHSIFLPERKLPGIVSRAVVAISTASQIAKGFCTNVVKLLAGKAHPYDGLDVILTSFYALASAGRSSDVPLISAGKVMRLSEEIISAALLPAQEKGHLDATVASKAAQSGRAPDFLVLGGSGFIGQRVVSALAQTGKLVRVLCRRSSRANNLVDLASIAYGDLKDIHSIRAALADARAVIHCAAAMSGDWAEFYESTVTGTKNVLAAIEGSKVERFVYISSLGVIDYNNLSNGDDLNESSGIETRPGDRGFYTRAKVEAEQVVREFAATHDGITTVILRPGLVYGRESNNNLQNCGILLDRFLLVFGCGGRRMGLNYVENLADAVVTAAVNEVDNGALFHIVDLEQPTVRQIIVEHNHLSNDRIIPLYIPIFIWRLLFSIVDAIQYLRTGKRGTFLYRFASNSKTVNYRCDKALNDIGWLPKNNFKESFLETYSE